MALCAKLTVRRFVAPCAKPAVACRGFVTLCANLTFPARRFEALCGS